MPYRIQWLDEAKGIYKITITDPFTSREQDAFFSDFFRFMNSAQPNIYGIFDVTDWSDNGMRGLSDPRFQRMLSYREKIRHIVMVSNNIIAVTAARVGARLAGQADWFHFTATLDEA